MAKLKPSSGGVAPEQEILDITEAAGLLRVHPRTVQALLRSEELVGRKAGKSWRIHRSAVNDFLLRRKPAGSEAPADGATAATRRA